MRRMWTYLLVLGAVVLTACNGINPPFKGTYDQVLIYYGMGYNNLSPNLRRNLMDELKSDILPGLHREKAIVAFVHNTAGSEDYITSNAPVLMRFYRDSKGKSVADTLKVYEDMDVSASPESIHRVLSEIQEAFPAKHYGLLVSSHGSGWVPAGYSKSSERATTLCVGNQFSGPRNTYTTQWVTVPELAGAIPMHLDYLILDACLAGAVEVAWDLKDVSDKLVVSPAEILTMGMGYSMLSWDMLAGPEPDLEGYCRTYYDYYNSKSGTYRSGTISLVESAKLPALAEAFSAILDAHRDALVYSQLVNRVQRYYYSNSALPFFYDLRDLAVQLGASSDELERLDAALAEAVPVHYETPSFFDLALNRCCGLSTYIPDPTRPVLNKSYKTLAWNKVVGLIQ